MIVQFSAIPMLFRSIAISLTLTAAAIAQAPRAMTADPVLAGDVSNDLFLRGKNIYDSAQNATDLANRTEYYQRSAMIFTEYLAMFPNHPNAEQAWWYLGNSQYQSGMIDDARRCFSTLINRYGKGKWVAAAAYTLAADHYNRGEYDFAAPMFERYAINTEKAAERPRGYFLAGNCYRMLGRKREAVLMLRKVIEDPAGAYFAPQAKTALGQLNAADGKFKEALTLFEEALAANSATPKIRGEAALHAALAAAKLGKAEESDRYLFMILKSPGMEEFRAEAQTALMANAFSRKDYREVVRIFRSSASKATGEKEAMRLMVAARALMRLKAHSEALDLFREVERLTKPGDEIGFDAAYHRLLCFFQIEGQHVPEQVDAFLQLYKKTNPNDTRIHTAMMMKAEELYAKKETTKAAKMYSQINPELLSSNNQPGFFYQRGWCLAEAGDHSGAARSFDEFISRFPNDSRVPSALAKRAMAHAELADSRKALADYDQLIHNSSTPKELASLAWLESSRLSRKENNIPEMLGRYQGLLKNIPDLGDNLKAEANYWIGWGLVKTNKATESVKHLESARSLRPEAYSKHSGILLTLGYFAAQDSPHLADEVRLAIKNGYASDIPAQTLQWCGIQAYNSGDFKLAAQCLSLIASPDDPRSSPKEVWRYLAKARLEIQDKEGALAAADRALEIEDNPTWKADSLLDRGRALLLMDRSSEARIAADEAMKLQPQGRTSAGLRILRGDLEMKANDPRKAAAEYLIVANFHEDKELKPKALDGLVKALKLQGDNSQAEKYRDQLQSEFPDWKSH
jgi:tetratricopeptide (TPR) repeat protein